MTRAVRVRHRVLDWKFLAALAFLLMIAYLVIGGYTEQVAKGRRIDQLIHQGQDKDKDAEAARKAATAERDRLLLNQERLLRLVRQQNRRQAALGKYLKDAGVTLNIPDNLISPPANKKPRPPADAGGNKTVHPKQKTSPKPGPPDGPSPPSGGQAPQPAQPDPVGDLIKTLKGLLP